MIRFLMPYNPFKEISDVVEVFSNSRWNGSYKLYTKNCSECQYYRFIEKEDRCYWGIAWKCLIKNEKQRKCSLLNETSPRYLELLSHNAFVKDWKESLKD